MELHFIFIHRINPERDTNYAKMQITFPFSRFTSSKYIPYSDINTRMDNGVNK